MIVDDLFENVAGPEKCWTGYKKVGTKPGTGRNAGKRVNDCEKIGESAGELNIGDPVIITGDVEFQGKTGDVREIGRDGSFVVVNLYNYGPQSFHSSDVSYNDYADEADEEDVAEGSFGSGYGSVFTLHVNTGEKSTTKTKTKKFKREDDAVLWAEDYADQHEMFPNLKMEIQDENGNVVWELEDSQGVAEGDTDRIADRYDPEEFDDMVLRLKTLAGAGPLKTVWDPERRVYKNVPINPPQDKK
jgi:hypothetical protein